MMNNKQIGEIGESIASSYLTNLGYKIIAKNWHYSRNAEIDIIAEEDKNTLVFVEVKTRTTNQFGHPFEAIDSKKIEKIHTAILGYLSSLEKKYKSYRIDGIAITGLKSPVIEHIKNISLS